MVAENPKRIALWSSPRLMSTALMYAFAGRSDTNVVDEPLHAYYLGFSAQELPWRKEVLSSMDKDPGSIMNTLMYCDLNKPLLFIKNMSHQVIGLQWDFLREFTNFFLIQDPEEVVAEFLSFGIKPTKIDLSFDVQYQMLLYLIEIGIEPIVIKAETLRSDPDSTMETLCRKLNIPWEESMKSLSQNSVSSPAWGKQCYEELTEVKSLKTVPSSRSYPDEYKILIEEVRPAYERLARYAVKD